MKASWCDDMGSIQRILQTAADACFDRGELGSQACVRYRASSGYIISSISWIFIEFVVTDST